MKRSIYLDHNATTPIAPEAARAMASAAVETFGNPSSGHAFGRAARRLVDDARRKVAALIGARPSQIVFTSGGTEADNLAIQGLLGAAATAGSRSETLGRGPGVSRSRSRRSRSHRPHLVTTTIEHHAVLDTAARLEELGVAEVTRVPVGASGVVDPDAVVDALRPETVLVSVMHANNEIGTIQPVARLARACRERGIWIHTDAVQSAGKLPIDVNALGVDALSISAHKFYGPKGIGALWLRPGVVPRPLLHGGSQERAIRPGTENLLGIVGMGEAARVAAERLAEDAVRIAGLRDRFEAALLERVEGVSINGDRECRVPNTSSVSIAGVDAEALAVALDEEGVACSTGSACASGAYGPSHVLTAIGLDSTAAHSTMRIAWGRLNDERDLDVVLDLFPRLVGELRSQGVFEL